MSRTGAVSVAVIVPTPELLKQMLHERPACWTWAAFASVVFQRWAAVEERKVIQVLGSPVRPTGRLQDGPEVAQFVARHMRAVHDVLERLEELQIRAMLGQPDIWLGPVPLRTVTDDRLVWSILDRLRTID